MGDLSTILNQRVKKSEHSSKMAAMAKQSAEGNMSSFAGLFSISELSEREKISIEEILQQYAQEDQDIDGDLKELISITSEVKAINNQAALLHGERIKKAHDILTKYRDGAFTAWLLSAYGNRQTPYNLMQYYEFYESLPKDLRPQLEAMPRQAIYTLAARAGNIDKKKEIVKNYKGETKAQVIHLIRQIFPLDKDDGRQKKAGEGLVQVLERFSKQVRTAKLSYNQKRRIRELLQDLHRYISKI